MTTYIYVLFVAATRPFVIGVFTDDATALTAPTTGFSLDYTQVYHILGEASLKKKRENSGQCPSFHFKIGIFGLWVDNEYIKLTL